VDKLTLIQQASKLAIADEKSKTEINKNPKLLESVAEIIQSANMALQRCKIPVKITWSNVNYSVKVKSQ
jgi:hypothetical protein